MVFHFSYGYATQLVELEGIGKVNRVVAPHDAGRIINPTLLKGQIQGALVMGLGYGLSEDLPLVAGRLIVQNRLMGLVDEAEILGHAREMGQKLWAKLRA